MYEAILFTSNDFGDYILLVILSSPIAKLLQQKLQEVKQMALFFLIFLAWLKVHERINFKFMYFDI